MDDLSLELALARPITEARYQDPKAVLRILSLTRTAQYETLKL